MAVIGDYSRHLGIEKAPQVKGWKALGGRTEGGKEQLRPQVYHEIRSIFPLARLIVSGHSLVTHFEITVFVS